jgi:lipid-A-disaccharide synthase
MKIFIFIIAGEASGDKLGALLMREMRKCLADYELEFIGIGGELMIKEGLHCAFPMEQLAVMGYWEVLNSIFKIYKILKDSVSFAMQLNPDIVITIDSPGFTFRFIERLRKHIISQPLFIHYVSPSIWAYRYERIFKVKELFDHILLLLPFEKRYYDEIGLDNTFVGHSVVEDEDVRIMPSQLKKAYDIPAQDNVIILMPGSRKTELKLHLPVFKETISILREKFPNTFFVIPTLKSQEEYVTAFLMGIEKTLITSEISMKNQLTSIAKLAIIKSGTSSLELMQKRVPHIVGYKVSKVTSWILRHFFKLDIPYVSLGNIIAEASIIPEFLQENFTAENLAQAAANFIENNKLREEQINAFNTIMDALGEHKIPSPSVRAANAIAALYLKAKHNYEVN